METRTRLLGIPEWNSLFPSEEIKEKFVSGENIFIPASFKECFYAVHNPAGDIVDFGFPRVKHPALHVEILDIFTMDGYVYPSDCFFLVVEDENEAKLAIRVDKELIEANL